jgi:hypothetical protein
LRKPARKKQKRKKLTVKGVARKISKLIYKYVVEDPEKERERDIAEIERSIARQVKKLRKKK